MQKIVYTGKFLCELCKKEVSMPVYGDSSPAPEDVTEWIDWCRHFHWIDFHRVCAVCGKILKSGELELAINDGKLKINRGYTDEYETVKRGNKMGPLLMVHDECVNQ